MSVSWQQAKAAHTNTRVSTRVALAADLVDEHARLSDELVRARGEDERLNRDPVAPVLAQQILDLEDRIAATEVEFTFEGLGRGAYARLIADHPAEPGQRDEQGNALPYNPDTFQPALFAASCVVPAELAGNVAEWTEIHQEWSVGQVTRLWDACVRANAGVATAPKSLIASAVLRSSESS